MWSKPEFLTRPLIGTCTRVYYTDREIEGLGYGDGTSIDSFHFSV